MRKTKDDFTSNRRASPLLGELEETRTRRGNLEKLSNGTSSILLDTDRVERGDAKRSTAFYRWLIPGQIKRIDAVGDIARDVYNDPKFPPNIEAQLPYLRRMRACDAAIQAWRTAHEEWLHQTSRRVA